MGQKAVRISASRGPFDAFRPDLKSPRCALSIGAVISETLPLDSSLHGGHFGKKGLQTTVPNARENGVKRKGNGDKKTLQKLSKHQKMTIKMKIKL